MNELLAPTSKKILLFDSSELDDWMLCKRRWHLVHHFQLQSLGSSHALDRGSLLHLVLAEYYRQKMIGIEESFAIELAIEYGRVQSLTLESFSPADAGEVYFQFREYCRYYSTIQETFYPLAIEQPFVKVIYEDDELIIALQGVIDYIGQYIGSREKILMDHKGMSKREEYTSLRNQFKNYCIATELDTIWVNKIGFQKTVPVNERMSRQKITYYPDQLEEQKEVLISEGKMMLASLELEYFPPNFTSCDKWGGCQFKTDFCERRPGARLYSIGNNYVIGKKWDVGLQLEEKK